MSNKDERRSLGLYTIYLVDDDPDYQEVTRTVLESAGYGVTCFSSPDEAMRQAEQEPPDLVITDLMMGSLDDGLQLSRSLKTNVRTREVPVLLVTGMVRELGLDIVPQKEQELDALYANAFLEKPTAPQALIGIVKKLLGN